MKRRKQQIQVKGTLLPSIRKLRRLAYKKIFEGLNYFEEKDLDRGLSLYPKANLTIKEIDELISINNIMGNLEKGNFREMIEKVKEFKLDYKSIYGLS